MHEKDSKPPTSATKKRDMQNWLRDNKIPFELNMTKVELYQLVKQNKGDPIYEIDQVLHGHGHTVLRLPPYHCDLSPIELIWSQIKGRVARDNCNFTVAGILEATQSSINQVKNENWLKCCEHVMKVENEYKKKRWSCHSACGNLCY